MSEQFKLPYEIRNKYSQELSDIQEILCNIEKGNICKINNDNFRMDGSLQHNCLKLRQKIAYHFMENTTWLRLN